MKIEGKNYKIPEINVKTIAELEKYGVYILYNEYKSVLTLISGFICITAHVSQEESYKIIEKQYLSGNGINEWLEDINNALEVSEFVKQIINKPKPKNSVFKFAFKNGSELE